MPNFAIDTIRVVLSEQYGYLNRVEGLFIVIETGMVYHHRMCVSSTTRIASMHERPFWQDIWAKSGTPASSRSGDRRQRSSLKIMDERVIPL